MSKLYQVKLAPGFNAAGRTRAGVTLEKGVTSILELTKEQLAALEADVWITVAEAPEGAKVTAPGESAPEGDEEETQTDPYEGKGLKDLQAMAAEANVDVTGIRSKQGVIDALEAAKNQDPAGGTSYEEHVTDGIRYFKDGDKIVAVEDEGFTDLQNSLAGFGETEEEALAELKKAQELADNLDEEEVEISEDMDIEDLRKIAVDAGVEAPESYEDKKLLIEAIEKASADAEE